MPVTADWLTGVYGVRGAAAPPNGMEAGPKRVPFTARSVAHAVSPKNWGCSSPRYDTAQLRTGLISTLVRGPPEVIDAARAGRAPATTSAPARLRTATTAAQHLPDGRRLCSGRRPEVGIVTRNAIAATSDVTEPLAVHDLTDVGDVLVEIGRAHV